MSPMHFQYLVGLCCLRCHPDAVEMTLGDKVQDAASSSRRDVDVTITAVGPGGTRSAFIGYEAKMEDKALHIDDVEQLCAKLNDMPDLTTRAIVSAKGFSDTAVKKAAAHGVKVFEFRDWKESIQTDFPHTSMEGSANDSLLFTQAEFRWVEPITSARINPEDPIRAGYLKELKNDMTLLDAEGNRHPKYCTLGEFFGPFSKWLSTQLAKTPEAEAVRMSPLPYPPNKRPDGPVGEPLNFPNLMCPIEEPIYFQTSRGLQQLKQVQLSATLQWHFKRVQAEFRVLVDVQSQDVYAGAAITTHPIHSDVLMAVTLSPENALVQLRPIHLTVKQQNFICRLKVRVEAGTRHFTRRAGCVGY